MKNMNKNKILLNEIIVLVRIYFSSGTEKSIPKIILIFTVYLFLPCECPKIKSNELVDCSTGIVLFLKQRFIKSFLS